MHPNRRCWGCLLACLVPLCLATAARSADLTQAVARVKPSVVLLGTFEALANPRFVMRGTGFVVAQGAQTSSNWVITNAHVLAPDAVGPALRSLVVQIAGVTVPWQMRQAEVLQVDRLHDLALLRFEGPPVAGLQVRDSADVQEGQEVGFTGFPLGNALGFAPVSHRGMVASIVPAALPPASAQQLSNQSLRGLRRGSFDMFQIDGMAYPGNSGGPLFDARTGDVLGVINMVVLRATHEAALGTPSGISYAIPSRYVLQLMQRQGSQQP